MSTMRNLTAAMTALACIGATSAFADDLVKMTIGQRGNWDTSITHLGDKAGIFKKHGLQLEMIYTSGSGETLQPVIAGGVDLGLAVGTLGAIAAFFPELALRGRQRLFAGLGSAARKLPRELADEMAILAHEKHAPGFDEGQDSDRHADRQKLFR